MNIPIYIGTSEKLNNIRCIKAARDIKEGELIESCPIILLAFSELDYHDKTVLSHYSYNWNDTHDAFVLGYCVLTNHSYEPNAKFVRNFKTKKMEYFAIKDIKKDEEILINYNGIPTDYTPVDTIYTNYKL